jgi:tripartite-type tricarboxylate transporter receptor subunit TctC
LRTSCRHHVVIVVLVAALATCSALPSMATEYPTRPIKFVVGYPAGGSTDGTARVIGARLAERLGQPVIIDNKPGGGTVIAVESVIRSAPDGHTVMFGTATMAVFPSYRKGLTIDARRDLAPVTTISTGSFGVFASVAQPARSIRELIALAKARPGELNYASSGIGTSNHLVGELFKSVTKTDIVHVPYKGAAPALAALMTDEAHLLFEAPIGPLQHVKAGKLRLLALTSPKREAAFPDVPTVAESGVPGFEAIWFQGLFVPAKTPKDVVKKLQTEVAAVLRLPEVQDYLARQGAEPTGDTPEEFTKRYHAEIDKWAKVMHEAGVKPE